MKQIIANVKPGSLCELNVSKVVYASDDWDIFDTISILSKGETFIVISIANQEMYLCITSVGVGYVVFINTELIEVISE